jgi:hypothetical protein
MPLQLLDCTNYSPEIILSIWGKGNNKTSAKIETRNFFACHFDIGGEYLKTGTPNANKDWK